MKTTHRPCSVLRQAATHVETQVSDEGDAARPQTAAEGSAEFVGPAISFLESQASDLAVSPTVRTHGGSAHEDNSSYSAAAPVAPPAAAAAATSSHDDCPAAGHPCQDLAPAATAEDAAPSSSRASTPASASVLEQKRGASSGAVRAVGPDEQPGSVSCGSGTPGQGTPQSTGGSDQQPSPRSSSAGPSLQSTPHQLQPAVASDVRGVGWPSDGTSSGIRPGNILLLLANMKLRPEVCSPSTSAEPELSAATAPPTSSERHRSITAPDIGGSNAAISGGSHCGRACDQRGPSEEALLRAAERACIRQRFLQGKIRIALLTAADGRNMTGMQRLSTLAQQLTRGARGSGDGSANALSGGRAASFSHHLGAAAGNPCHDSGSGDIHASASSTGHTHPYMTRWNSLIASPAASSSAASDASICPASASLPSGRRIASVTAPVDGSGSASTCAGSKASQWGRIPCSGSSSSSSGPGSSCRPVGSRPSSASMLRHGGSSGTLQWQPSAALAADVSPPASDMRARGQRAQANLEAFDMLGSASPSSGSYGNASGESAVDDRNVARRGRLRAEYCLRGCPRPSVQDCYLQKSFVPGFAPCDNVRPYQCVID